MQESETPPIKLTWDVVLKQFDRLIKFAAKQQILNNSTDSMVTAEDLYQEGLIKLYDCWTKWCVDPERNKDMDEFGPIFRTSLFRHMKKHTSFNPTEVDTVDLENVFNFASPVTVEGIMEDMYRDQGIGALKGLLSSEVSIRLLEELVEPSVETLFEMYADIKRKQMIKSQGKKVNIPKDTTVRMKHIQKSMGITVKQYDTAMSEIRSKAPLVLERV